MGREDPFVADCDVDLTYVH